MSVIVRMSVWLLLFILVLPGATTGGVASAQVVTKVPLRARGIVYDAARGKIYATVGKEDDPAAAATAAPQTSVLAIVNPITGQVEKTVPVADDPGTLVLSAGSKYLYILVSGGRSVQRYDITTQTVREPFALGSDLHASGILPMPGEPEAVVIMRYVPLRSPGDEGLAVYDTSRGTAIVRPGIVKIGSHLAPGLVPGRLYGYQARISTYGVSTVEVGKEGVIDRGEVRGLIGGYVGVIGAGGLLFNSSGGIIDPEARRGIGQLPGTGLNAGLCPDMERGRVYQALADRSGGVRVVAYDLRTREKIGTMPLPQVSPRRPRPNHSDQDLGLDAGNLIRWGEDGLAFTTGQEIVLVRTHLGPRLAPVDLSVARTMIPRPSRPERKYTYTLSVRNNSATATASEVILTDVLPSGANVLEALSTQGTATAGEGLLRAEIGSLPPGAVVTVTVTLNLWVTPPRPIPSFLKRHPSDLMRFCAVVRGFEPDAAPQNNIAEQDVSRFVTTN